MQLRQLLNIFDGGGHRLAETSEIQVRFELPISPLARRGAASQADSAVASSASRDRLAPPSTTHVVDHLERLKAGLVQLSCN
jgi:hypothetical protein